MTVPEQGYYGPRDKVPMVERLRALAESSQR